MHTLRSVAFAAALSLTLVTATPTQAQSGDETVARLHRACVGELASKKNGLCEAYLSGAAETLSAFGNGGNEAGICGIGVQSGELSRIFVAWAADNQQAADLPRLVGVTLALRQRFPCKPVN